MKREKRRLTRLISEIFIKGLLHSVLNVFFSKVVWELTTDSVNTIGVIIHKVISRGLS